jgi:hypothetical protein
LNGRKQTGNPERKIFDHPKLIKMVLEGAPQTDIMKKFGYGTSTQLKVVYANALIQSEQVPGITGGRGAGDKGEKAVKKLKSHTF